MDCVHYALDALGGKMQLSSLIRKSSTTSLIVKFNALMLVLLVTAGTLLVSFADTGTIAAATSCGAKVSLVLDRSSSIGDPKFNGSQAFIDSVRNGAGELVKALQGDDSYLDYYAFASNAKRADQENRHQLTASKVNTLVSRLSALKFKTSTAVDTYTDDGINAAGEGLTNWEQALITVENYSNYQGLPRHIVIFTDGEPTTNVPHLNAAIAAGGSYSAAGYAGEDGVSPDDLSRAFTVADRLRSQGVTIIAVGVGDTAGYASNLSRLAGGSNNVYMASNINQLSAKFKEAASRLCVAKSVVLYKALEKKADGTTVPISLPIVSRSQHNDGTSASQVNVTTTTGAPEWVAAPDGGLSFTKAFDVRGTATIPTGYRAVSDECRILSATGTPAISQVGASVSDPKEVLVQRIASGAWIGCTFIVEKATTNNPAISIEKTVSPVTAKVGETVTYSFTVKNTGNMKLKNVKVTDPMLGGQIGQTLPSLLPGESGPTFTKEYKIPVGAPSIINNTATAVGTPTGTVENPDAETNVHYPDVTATDTAQVTVPATPNETASIELTKTVNPTTAKAGDTVTYSFVVKNTGNMTLTDVKVTDPMLGGQVGTTIPTLAPGASAPAITKTYVIPASAKNSVKNEATATGTPVDSSGNKKSNVTDKDDAEVTLITPPGVASWTVTKKADKTTVVPGETVTYTITVKNTSTDVTLTNFKVSDPTIGFPADGKPVVIDSLAPGASKDITATYKVPANYSGTTFKNKALVCVPVSGKDDCKEPEAEVKIARLQITKTSNKDTVFPGTKVTYTFVVKNTGGVSLDPGMVVDDILGEIGDPGVLKADESKTFTKDYTVPTTAKVGDKIKNTVTVCAPVPDKTQPTLRATDCKTSCPTDATLTLCDQDDHTVTVDIPSLTIEKSADKTTANVGDTVKYTFVVTNTGKTTLKDISVKDNVLGDLGKIDELKPGASAEKSIDYVVPTNGANIGTIDNVATACFADPVYTPNCASDDHRLSVTNVQGTTVTRPTTGGSLPFTGAQGAAWLAGVGAGIMALGSALIFLSRKKKAAL